jgi:tetratricopeptide (TPR) repeat protein
MLAHAELAAGRPKEAARLFGAVASEEGGLDRYRDVRYKRAVALSASGNHRKSLELLEALEADERVAVSEKAVLALEADIHRALEHYKASADRYRAMLARWPEEPEAGRWLLALAEMEEARGRVDEALGAYQRWLEGNAEDPAAPVVRLSVARLLVAAGRSEEAWASLEGLSKADNPQLASQASLLRGRIALEKRDYKAALEANSKAAEGLPADSPAHALARWRMARAFEGAGRPEEAAAHYTWLVQNATDAQVREASKERLQQLAAKVKGRENKTQ